MSASIVTYLCHLSSTVYLLACRTTARSETPWSLITLLQIPVIPMVGRAVLFPKYVRQQSGYRENVNVSHTMQSEGNDRNVLHFCSHSFRPTILYSWMDKMWQNCDVIFTIVVVYINVWFMIRTNWNLFMSLWLTCKREDIGEKTKRHKCISSQQACAQIQDCNLNENA